MKYLVWSPDLGSDISDARTVDACSAESAATAWAQDEDACSADYWIVGGDGASVCVATDEAGTDAVKFRVVGEPSIHYSARPIRAADGEVA